MTDFFIHSKKQWVDGTEAKYQNWNDYKFKYSHTAMLKVWPGNKNKRGRWTTMAKTKTFRFVCSRYRQGKF